MMLGPDGYPTVGFFCQAWPNDVGSRWIPGYWVFLPRPKFIECGIAVRPNDSGFRCPAGPSSFGPSWNRIHWSLALPPLGLSNSGPRVVSRTQQRWAQSSEQDPAAVGLELWAGPTKVRPCYHQDPAAVGSAANPNCQQDLLAGLTRNSGDLTKTR
jgi:hypothetical protein